MRFIIHSATLYRHLYRQYRAQVSQGTDYDLATEAKIGSGICEQGYIPQRPRVFAKADKFPGLSQNLHGLTLT